MGFVTRRGVLVRRLRTRFGKNGGHAGQKHHFFPCALHHHSFRFGRGVTSSGRQKAAILDFQYGRHLKSISVNILAWKALRRSILVSKYTISESRNALESLKIALDDYVCRDQFNIFILALKRSGSAVGLSENPSAVKKWMIAGPEQARLLNFFNQEHISEDGNHIMSSTLPFQ